MQWVHEGFEKCSTHAQRLMTRIVQCLSEKPEGGFQALNVECEELPVAPSIEMTQNTSLD